jgi:hypothetical protein
LKRIPLLIICLIALLNPHQLLLASELISTDPTYLNRGLKGITEVGIIGGKLPHTYQIIKDPTGTAPTDLIERFEVRAGDCGLHTHGSNGGATTDCNSGRTRVEVVAHMTRVKSKWSKSAKEFWYGYSIFIPKDYPVAAPYAMPYLGQWEQLGDSEAAAYAPTLAVNESHGVLRSNGAVIASQEDLKGKWHKIEVHARWSAESDGFIRVYGNEELVWELTEGSTASRDRIAFKYGLYRHKTFGGLKYPEDWSYPTQIVYYSNVKIGKTRKDLAPD